MGFESSPPSHSGPPHQELLLEKAKSKFSTQGLVQGRTRPWSTPLPSSSSSPPPTTKPDVWLERTFKFKSSVIIIPLGLSSLVWFDILTTEPTKSPKKSYRSLFFLCMCSLQVKSLKLWGSFTKNNPHVKPLCLPLFADQLIIEYFNHLSKWVTNHLSSE